MSRKCAVDNCFNMASVMVTAFEGHPLVPRCKSHGGGIERPMNEEDRRTPRSERKTVGHGFARLEIVTYETYEDGYLCGHLHSRKGWHWYYQATVFGVKETLTAPVDGPYATEAEALAAARSGTRRPIEAKFTQGM